MNSECHIERRLSLIGWNSVVVRVEPLCLFPSFRADSQRGRGEISRIQMKPKSTIFEQNDSTFKTELRQRGHQRLEGGCRRCWITTGWKVDEEVRGRKGGRETGKEGRGDDRMESDEQMSGNVWRKKQVCISLMFYFFPGRSPPAGQRRGGRMVEGGRGHGEVKGHRCICVFWRVSRLSAAVG